MVDAVAQKGRFEWPGPRLGEGELVGVESLGFAIAMRASEQNSDAFVELTVQDGLEAASGGVELLNDV